MSTNSFCPLKYFYFPRVLQGLVLSFWLLKAQLWEKSQKYYHFSKLWEKLCCALCVGLFVFSYSFTSLFQRIFQNTLFLWKELQEHVNAYGYSLTSFLCFEGITFILLQTYEWYLLLLLKAVFSLIVRWVSKEIDRRTLCLCKVFQVKF